MANTTARAIIHLDLDAFYCSVEEQWDPTLVGKPFAVGGRPEHRGVVASCSYAARRFGVHSAMPMARAVRRCPHLIILPARFPVYRAASREVMNQLRAVTPLVEQISIDEAFLDVSDLAESVVSIAARLQQQIRDELRLACSIGVATNKLVAKIATDAGKAAARAGYTPRALCVVPSGEEALFLAPLPVTALWGVGEKTEQRLAALGIHTIGDLAAWPPSELVARFGQHGVGLGRHALGIDDRPIVTERASKSISQETTFARDVRDVATLERTLRDQAVEVAESMRRKGLVGMTVRIKIRWSDFTTPTRQVTFPQPTDDLKSITDAGIRLLHDVWQTGQSVRLIGIGVSGLSEPPNQMSLWDQPSPEDIVRRERVASALAAIEARMGLGVVRRGSELSQDEPV